MGWGKDFALSLPRLRDGLFNRTRFTLRRRRVVGRKALRRADCRLLDICVQTGTGLTRKMRRRLVSGLAVVMIHLFA